MNGRLLGIPAGVFRMGDDSPWAYETDGETPSRLVEIDAFAMEWGPVTNTAFAAFVDATGHITDAERFGWSFVFAGLLPDDFPETRAVLGMEWWRQVEGASWRHPEGPGSDVSTRADHPVVHVSWNDARAYAAWTGGRLPAEAEWERAARGGTDTTWPWGSELEPGGRRMANVFDGDFPVPAGPCGTTPVGTYPPNGYGLVDVIGNVWEWTADAFGPTERVLKGGSYLCHASYCRRYRPGARRGDAPTAAAGNVGFRVAY